MGFTPMEVEAIVRNAKLQGSRPPALPHVGGSRRVPVGFVPRMNRINAPSCRARRRQLARAGLPNLGWWQRVRAKTGRTHVHRQTQQ
jgi:hypothetical protein